MALKALARSSVGKDAIIRAISEVPGPEEVLEAAVAAERSYLRTARNLGGSEDVAQRWAAAVMLRVGAEVEELVLANRGLLEALHEDLLGGQLKQEP